MRLPVLIEKCLEARRARREFSDQKYLAELLAARREIRGGRGIPATEVFKRKDL